MPTPVTTEDLRDFLKADLTDMDVAEPLGDDDPLFSSGLLDSVAMMNLITFIEEKSGSDVRASDVTLDNFDTLARIVGYAATLA
jgi:acyl carrier protein